MKIFLASGIPPYILETIYTNNNKYNDKIYEPLIYLKNNNYKINILQSFYCITSYYLDKIHLYDNFLLDSGAFTFMNNQKKDIDWGKYIDDYINCINQYDIKHFFELDIDCIVGHEKVKEMRKYIENKTNRKSIPVWHKSRGLNEFINLSQQYNYIAIGGIVTKEITKKEYPYFNKLLKIAKDNNCKVHGLGFTSANELKKYDFFSVDSTAWCGGSRFGLAFKFNQGEIKYYEKKSENKRAKDKEITINNFCQWIKFANYMDKYY